ncbi:unnamed protein product, partial [Owenia fusiformis]
CIPTIYTCPQGAEHSLAKRCANSNLDPFSTYKQQNYAYHSWACLICSETDRPRPTCTIRLRQIGRQGGSDLSMFSFKIIVDVTSETGITLRSQAGHGIGGLNVEVACRSDDSDCKALACPKAYEKVGNEYSGHIWQCTSAKGCTVS